MKKLSLLICLLLLIPFTSWAGPPSPKSVDNTAYNATSWNGVKHKAPSKDAVRDKIESILTTLPSGISIEAVSGANAYFTLTADAGEDNNDKWRFVANDGGAFDIESYQSGSWANVLTVSNTGALSSINDLPADIVDSADINWDEPITAPFDKKVQFGDTGIYIFADDDGILDIVADTSVDISNLQLATNASFGNFDVTLADKISGYDANVFIDFGADGRLIIQADGAGSPFSTPDIDITGTSYFDDDSGFALDKKIYFGDAGVFIESDDDGYLDVDADVGIRLNQDVTASGTLTVGTSTVTISSSAQVFTMAGTGGTYNEDLTFDLDTATANEVTLGTGTGVDTISSAISLETTGHLSGNIEITPDADGHNVTATEARGGLIVETGNQQTVVLPSAVVGMSCCVLADGADGSAEVYVDCDGSDHFEYDGTTMANGEYIYNNSDKKGDRMCFVAIDVSTWVVFYGGDTTVAEETP